MYVHLFNLYVNNPSNLSYLPHLADVLFKRPLEAFPRANCGFLLVCEPAISVIVIDGVGLHSWSAESFVVL